ncbi:MAG: TerB family tellurite resistance protein [Pseudomonadota bacterium]
MIRSIKKFFEENLFVADAATQSERTHRMELTSAALLFELMTIDGHFDERESDAIADVLLSTFALDKRTLDEIVALAKKESRQASSLYDFTSLVNVSYSYEQRVQLIENLWRVAYADDRIDRYEDNFIRRIADLIYVNHSDFIKSKLKVRDTISVDKGQ